MQALTFGDLTKFVLEHKGNSTFRGYSKEHIMMMLAKGVEKGTLYYATDYNNNITGMILATKHEDTKILFIDENLAGTKANLMKFAARAQKEFVGYKLEWYKKGTHQLPNTNKVYAKLLSKTN